MHHFTHQDIYLRIIVDKLKIQHEALKRVLNIYDNVPIHCTNESEETPIIEKIQAPIKPKRRTKKDIKELMA